MGEEDQLSPPGQQSGDARLWADIGHLTALLAALQEGVVIQDAGAGIVTANATAERILGLTLAQMRGQSSLDPLWQSIRADGSPLPGTEHPAVRCLTTGEPQTDEIMGIQSGGGLRWLKVNAQPVRQPGQEDTLPRAVVATFHDVTAELVQARTRPDPLWITAAGESSGELLARVDATGRIIKISPSSLRVLGHDASALVGTFAQDLLHPEDAKALQQDPSRAQRPVATYRVAHADGSYRHIEASTYVHHDDDGKVEVVDLVGRDVTERQVAQDALRQAEERFRLAFDMAPTGNAIVLPDGRFMRVNTRLAQLLEVESAELLGRQWVDFVPGEEQSQLKAFLARTVAADEGPRTREFGLVRGSGEHLYIAVTASVVHDESARPAYVIAQIEDITHHKQTQRTLTHQATHDPLTALPNRALLLDRLGAALKRTRHHSDQVALLFCDVDRFKRINDSLGHEAGDLMLIELAHRLRRSIRHDDVAGRMSGDEFLVICEGVTSRDDALARAERIRAIADDPIVIGDQTLGVSLSVGVALAGHDDEPAIALRRADTAMYEAKERGRGRVQVYDETLRDNARERLRVETDLRIAINTDQLRLHHQPIVKLDDGTVVGREALVRWQHPDRGLLLPGDFLDVAEESDLIIGMGQWVLDEACRQTILLQRHVGHFRVGVNVSARQLARPGFGDSVEHALDDSGLAAECLVLELTETSLLHASPATSATIEALAEAGVRLAIDDFGTGYSSLTYLQKLPVRIVKIDQSFVADITTDSRRRAITQAVIRLGDVLDLDIVAEGVETADQARTLTDLGCELAQGYLFGRPSPWQTHVPGISQAV